MMWVNGAASTTAQVDDTNVLPAITAILAASNISTFPYVTVGEVDSSLAQHESSGSSSPLDKAVRARLNQTLRYVCYRSCSLVWNRAICREG